MVAAGIGVYVGGGGSGEGFVLTPGERRRILEIAAEELSGKVAFRSMGVETRSADEMIEYARVAEAVGVDAAQIYSLDLGHGHLPTQAEVLEYLTDVLSATTVAVRALHSSISRLSHLGRVDRASRRPLRPCCRREQQSRRPRVSRRDRRRGRRQGGRACGWTVAGIDRARARRERVPELGGQPRASAVPLGDRRVRAGRSGRVVCRRSAGSPDCRWRSTATAGSAPPRRC